MAKDKARDYVAMECTECKRRNYLTSKRMKGSPYKVEVKKYCKWDKKHTVHKERKK
jgi:large subunit ribosomal protein L33